MKSMNFILQRNKLMSKMTTLNLGKAKNDKIHIVDLFLNQINEDRHHEITKNILSKI